MSEEAHRPQYELVAVFRSQGEADEAARRLHSIGVDDAAISVGDPRDEITSLKAEMRDELTEGWILPQAGLALTKEGAKGLSIVTVYAAIIGAVVAAPFAFIDFGLTFAGRLVLLVLVGLAFGAAVGLVIGPALASKRPEEPMAAQRGVVVHVHRDSERIRSVLTDLRPVRLDERRVTLDDGTAPCQASTTRSVLTTDCPATVAGISFMEMPAAFVARGCDHRDGRTVDDEPRRGRRVGGISRPWAYALAATDALPFRTLRVHGRVVVPVAGFDERLARRCRYRAHAPSEGTRQQGSAAARTGHDSPHHSGRS